MSLMADKKRYSMALQGTSKSFKMERPTNPPKLRRTSTMDKIKALVLQ